MKKETCKSVGFVLRDALEKGHAQNRSTTETFIWWIDSLVYL